MQQVQVNRPAVAPAAGRVAMLSPAQEKKAAQLEELTAMMEDKALAFCVRSEGIKPNDFNQLRQKFPDEVKIQCVKNTLMRRAAGTEGLERFAAIAEGETPVTRMSNYWFFVPEDHMRDTVETWNKWVEETKAVRACPRSAGAAAGCAYRPPV